MEHTPLVLPLWGACRCACTVHHSLTANFWLLRLPHVSRLPPSDSVPTRPRSDFLILELLAVSFNSNFESLPLVGSSPERSAKPSSHTLSAPLPRAHRRRLQWLEPAGDWTSQKRARTAATAATQPRRAIRILTLQRHSVSCGTSCFHLDSFSYTSFSSSSGGSSVSVMMHTVKGQTAVQPSGVDVVLSGFWGLSGHPRPTARPAADHGYPYFVPSPNPGDMRVGRVLGGRIYQTIVATCLDTAATIRSPVFNLLLSTGTKGRGGHGGLARLVLGSGRPGPRGTLRNRRSWAG